jgi:hypothetical protein
MTKTQNNNEGMSSPNSGEVAELVKWLNQAWEHDGWCDEQGQCWWFNQEEPAMSNPHIATTTSTI